MLTTTAATLARAREGRLPAPARSLALAGETDLPPSSRPRPPNARPGPRQRHLLFAQGFHPAHPALPRRLPLLHLRASRRVPGQRAYMTAEEVLDIARAGAAAGCKEALFTLGDKPELRYKWRSANSPSWAPIHHSYLTAMASSSSRRPASSPTPTPAS